MNVDEDDKEMGSRLLQQNSGASIWQRIDPIGLTKSMIALKKTNGGRTYHDKAGHLFSFRAHTTGERPSNTESTYRQGRILTPFCVLGFAFIQLLGRSV